MAINTAGFDNADITEAGFAKLVRVSGELAYKHGVTSGLAVSAAGGTRTVSISAGEGMAPGLWFESTATESLSFAANTGGSNRVDYVVVNVNWSANSATLAVVQGSSSTPPSLTQTPGSTWQVPLARVTVRPSVTTLLASDIVACKPLPRQARKYAGSSIANKTISYSASAWTMSTVTIPDPGWPYILQISGAAKFSDNANGYGYLAVKVNGSALETARTSPLNDGVQPAWVNASSDAMTGPATATLTMEPAFMTSGSLTVQAGTNCWFTVIQIPA